jgi:hypothetical protein
MHRHTGVVRGMSYRASVWYFGPTHRRRAQPVNFASRAARFANAVPPNFPLTFHPQLRKQNYKFTVYEV